MDIQNFVALGWQVYLGAGAVCPITSELMLEGNTFDGKPIECYTSWITVPDHKDTIEIGQKALLEQIDRFIVCKGLPPGKATLEDGKILINGHPSIFSYRISSNEIRLKADLQPMKYEEGTESSRGFECKGGPLGLHDEWMPYGA